MSYRPSLRGGFDSFPYSLGNELKALFGRRPRLVALCDVGLHTRALETKIAPYSQAVSRKDPDHRHDSVNIPMRDLEDDKMT